MMKKLFFLLFLPACLWGQSDLYFINSENGIERMGTNGADRTVLIAWDFVTPQGIALDLSQGKLYWTDWISNKIQRANLDGSGVEDVITSGLDLPEGLEIDTLHQMVYWVDSGTKKIQRAKLDGTAVQDLVTYSLVNLDALALDLTAGKMYWTEWGAGAAFGRVKRANLDGSDIELLVSVHDAIFKGIALDLAQGKVYWTDCGFAKIQRCNLDGTALEDVVAAGSTPNSLDLDLLNGKIYWTDFGTHKIKKSDLDGSNVVTVLDDDLGSLQDIVLNIQVAEVSAVNTAELELPNIWPNPTSGPLMVEHPRAAELQVSVFDALGHLVWQQGRIGASGRIDLSGLPAGAYRAQFSDTAGRIAHLTIQKI